MTTTRTLPGSCHCGAVRVGFTTTLDPSATAPRACDCSFCRRHGAAWVSDPAGRLEIESEADALRAYRQGSQAAQFLLCGRCGVLVAVVLDHAGRRYGAANATSLEACDAFAPSVAASPQTLGRDDKIARWLKLWAPDVELRVR